jgi:hypothetical protein
MNMCGRFAFITGALCVCVGAVPVSSSIKEHTHTHKVHKAMSTLRKQLPVVLNSHRRLAKSGKSWLHHKSAGRQLTNATGQFCTWNNAACGTSLPAQTAIINALPANSPVKQALDQCQPCEGQTSENTCVGQHCNWDATDQECTCQMDDTLTETLMGALYPADCCGWVGTFLHESSKCGVETAATCASVSGCTMQSTDEVPDNAAAGDSCASTQECSMDSDSAMQAMCPGLPLSEQSTMMTDCTPTTQEMQSMTTNAQVQDFMMSCLRNKCSMFADMMESAFQCSGLDSTACTSNDNCQWTHLGQECEADMMQTMMAAVPDACPSKSIFSLMGACGASNTQNACESNQNNCVWSESMECSSSSSPTVLVSNSCEVHPAYLNEQMAAATCHADMMAFAQIMIAVDACAVTSEQACNAVVEPNPIVCQNNAAASCPGADSSTESDAASPSAVTTLTLPFILVCAIRAW